MSEQETLETQETQETLEIRPGVYWGTGRRKTSVARVRITPGAGQVIVNGRPFDEFFRRERDRKSILAPLKDTQTLALVDLDVNVKGGGITGQAGAMLLGVARSLRKIVPETEPLLRDKGYLTRDAREVERKKYGQPGARRSFQFSKR